FIADISPLSLHDALPIYVIPDTAYCEWDVRLLPGEDPQAFAAELRSVIADDHIDLEPISRYRKPNSSPTGTALYRTIEQVVHKRSEEHTSELQSRFDLVC